HRFVLWTSIVAITILMTITFIGFYVQCTPLASIWNPSVPGKYYFNEYSSVMFASAYSTCMDFILGGLPWLFLRKLKMKPRDKITRLCSLSIFAAGICGLVRTVNARALSTAKSNYPYENVQFQIWNSTELAVSIMCVCVPALQSLYRRYVKGLSFSESGGIKRKVHAPFVSSHSPVPRYLQSGPPSRRLSLEDMPTIETIPHRPARKKRSTGK
ncbi:hypothetical protein K432DRAFT_309161, partial [Lepidopterella palustris CBS 459.81]